MTDVPDAFPPEPPPLRIHHLLVATAVSAVFLSTAHMLIRHNPAGLATFFQSGFGMVHGLTVGVSVTMLGYLFTWRRQGRARFDQPGHWLLIQAAMGGAFYVMGLVMVAADHQGSGVGQQLLILAYNVFIWVGILVINVYAAWKVADTRAWQLFFAGQLAVWIAVVTLATVVHWGTEWIRVTIFLLLAIALIGDWRSHRCRDWPHWIGVGLTVFALVPYLAMQVWDSLR